MTPLVVIVEGPTEERFVKTLLAPELARAGVRAECRIVHPRPSGSSRLHRGGGGWEDWKAKIRNALRDTRSEIRFTTLFDLYGLPAKFPGRNEALHLETGHAKANCIEKALGEDLDDRRLIPYVQVHEFEALVLAALDGLDGQLDDSADVAGLTKLRAHLGHLPPEDINDGPSTAPSKRLKQAIPSYEKIIHGPAAIEAVGLDHVRTVCPRFATWLAALAALGR